MIKRKKSIPEPKVLTPKKLLQARENNKVIFLSSYKEQLKNNIERILMRRAERGEPIPTKFYFPREDESYNVSDINESVMKDFSNQGFIINKIPIEETSNFDIYTLAEHDIPNLLSFDENKDGGNIKIGDNIYVLYDGYGFYYGIPATITNTTSDHIYFEYPSRDSVREGSFSIHKRTDLIKYIQKQ